MSDPWSVFDAPATQPAVVAQPTPQAAGSDWSAFDVPAATSATSVAPTATAATSVAPQQTAANASDADLSHRFGVGARDVIEGVAGLPYNAAAWAMRQAGIPVNSLGDNLTALGLPQADTPSQRFESSIVQPVAGVLTGASAGRALATAASPIVQGVGEALAAQPVTQAAAAGIGGGVGEATDSPALGLAASLVAPLSAGAAGRVISPNILGDISPERAAVLATAQQENIPLTLAQMTGGKVARNMESTLANLPGSSGVQARVNDTQQAAWNAANLRRAGIDANVATPEVLNQGRADLGQVFNDLSARNTLSADPQFATELQGLAQRVNRYAPAEIRGPINAHIDDVLNGVQTGTMPGHAYREMDSQIGRTMRSTSNGDMRGYLGDLRDTLRGAMDRSISPEDQQAWRDVRNRYANLMTVAKSVDSPTEGSALGNISPAKLAQASRNQASKSFAFGRGNMDDLSRLGQVALKQTVPDSGTAQRTLMANMLTGKTAAAAVTGATVFGNPLLLAAPAAEVGIPRAVAGLYNSNALRRYLTNDLAAGIGPAPNSLLSIATQNQADRLRDR